MGSMTNPNNYVTFGPNANCTLELCSASESIYAYQPSLGVNAAFLAIFALFMVVSVAQGVRYKTWGFPLAIVLGCVCEVVGYGGRLILHKNPFSFQGFLLQIITLAIGPAFYSAAIYITLTKISYYLGRQYSRVPPKFYYWGFIPCDILALTFQGAGGGISATALNSSNPGVRISITGLSIQVVTLFIFICLCIDLAIRFWRDQACRPQHERMVLSTRFKVFVVFISLSIIFIFIRCAYRIDELHQGYRGDLFHNQGLFIALEGVMIILACLCLIIAHPGQIFSSENGAENKQSLSDSSNQTSTFAVDSEKAQVM